MPLQERMGRFRPQEVCWGSRHLLSLLSFHRLSFLLFSFLLVPDSPLRLPKKTPNSSPCFMQSNLTPALFRSLLPNQALSHREAIKIFFLNKEPAYVDCKYGDFLRLGLQPWSVCAWPKALAWLCSCRKPAGTQTSISAADKDRYLATLWSSYA